jgi:hypothetical protein
VLAAAVLIVRRRWPLATLAVATFCTSVYLVFGYAYRPILVLFMIAVYSAARHALPAMSAVYSLAALVLMLVHLLTSARAFGMLGDPCRGVGGRPVRLGVHSAYPAGGGRPGKG